MYMTLAIQDWPFVSQISSFVGEVMNIIISISDKIQIQNIIFYLLLFTIATKTIMLPLEITQRKKGYLNLRAKTEMDNIEKRFKDKKIPIYKTHRQVESLTVEKKYGIPASTGCLMSFIQLPIVIIIYNVIYNIDKFVPSIAAMTPEEQLSIYNFFSFDSRLATGIKASPIMLVPVCVILSQFLVTYLGNFLNGNKKIDLQMIVFPIISGVLCLRFPLFVSAYWIMQSIYTMIVSVVFYIYYKNKDANYFAEKQLKKMNENRTKRGLDELAVFDIPEIKAPETI